MIYDLLDLKEKELEIEIAEKDKEIEELKNKQLYKEDFKIFKFCYGCFNNNFDLEWKCYICGANKVIKLKDNSKYDKLPSKKK